MPRPPKRRDLFPVLVVWLGACAVIDTSRRPGSAWPPAPSSTQLMVNGYDNAVALSAGFCRTEEYLNEAWEPYWKGQQWNGTGRVTPARARARARIDALLGRNLDLSKPEGLPNWPEPRMAIPPPKL